MNDLISKADVCEIIADVFPTDGELVVEVKEIIKAYDAIIALPYIQPERKRGKWRHYEGYLTCSECRTEYDDDIMTHCCDDVPKFCQNCGADMRSRKQEVQNELNK